MTNFILHCAIAESVKGKRMAPTSGLPVYTSRTVWSLRRAWPSPTSVVSGKTIWFWNMAWRRRMDTLWGGEVQPGSLDEWVTEDEYLVLKLKGEA